MDGITQDVAGSVYSAATHAAARAIIGHNSGADLAAMLDPDILRDQLLLDHEKLISRREELLAGCVRYHDKFPGGPANDDDAGKASDFVLQIKKAAKEAETAHGVAKKPFLEAGRVVDTVLKQQTHGVLAGAASLIEGKISKYLVAKANRERQEAAALAKQRADEAQRLADLAAAEKNDQRAADLMDQAVEVAESADVAATRTTASSADLSRTRGTFGSVASLRDNWVYEVTDLMALVKAVADGREPLSYLMVNDAVVGGLVRPKAGVRAITGLKIENRQKAGIR